MSAPRSIKRQRERNAAKVAEGVQQAGPYRIRAAQFTVEVEFYNPENGKATDRKMTEPGLIFEDSPVWGALMDYFRQKGLTPTEWIPKAKQEAKQA